MERKTGMTNRKPASQVQHLRVFLSSPGDVAEERRLARKVLDALPYDPGLRGRISIEAVSWDDPRAPAPTFAHLTPQEAIDRGLPKPSDCDVVVAILWSRFGTPLPEEYVKPDGERYLSGTEWEHEDAMRAARASGRPEVLLYRRTEVPQIAIDDPEIDEKRTQYQRVVGFFGQLKNPDGSIDGGHETYDTPDRFRTLFDQHM